MRAKVLTLVKSPPEFPQGLAWKGCERYRAKVKLGDIGTTALDVHPKVDAVRALNSWGWMAFPLDSSVPSILSLMSLGVPVLRS